MRNIKFIGLLLFCFTTTLLKAENFSNSTDNGTVIETKVFPNPVANGENLVIEGSSDFEKIEIINIVGKKVVSEEFTPATTYNLNIKGLDKGIYLLKILYTDNTNIIKRIWVK